MPAQIRKWLLIVIFIYIILNLRTTCGCRPPSDLKKMLFTPGSVKFKIIYKNAQGTSAAIRI